MSQDFVAKQGCWTYEFRTTSSTFRVFRVTCIPFVLPIAAVATTIVRSELWDANQCKRLDGSDTFGDARNRSRYCRSCRGGLIRVPGRQSKNEAQAGQTQQESWAEMKVVHDESARVMKNAIVSMVPTGCPEGG